MWHTVIILASVLSVLNIALVTSFCNKPPFLNCTCGHTSYDNELQYVLNCTNTGFKNVSVLEKIPKETEVLLFVGNDLDSLPWNVFGNENHTNLKVVNLSNNKIREIKGKSFHHVPNVTMLILNFNKIDIAASRDHPRIFSNFENLKELHLTDAFDDKHPDLEFAQDLQAIFTNSSLEKLQKLHLEQNEIAGFDDAPHVFCHLPSVKDLYLGDNKLQHVNFKFDCLHGLRYIDFERNNITQLSANDMHILDALPARNQNLTIDLTGNPIPCDHINDLFDWFERTKVTIRRKDSLHCVTKASTHHETSRNCAVAQHLRGPDLEGTSGSSTVAFLSIALCVSLTLLIYTNREVIRASVYPLWLSLSRNIHYTTIGRQEAQEMDV
uniref:Trophoblast glycoprotein n=1 Tax=Lygus hesperus TaxID=30085 RepID=A0A0A9YYU4_LYGHE